MVPDLSGEARSSLCRKHLSRASCRRSFKSVARMDMQPGNQVLRCPESEILPYYIVLNCSASALVGQIGMLK